MKPDHTARGQTPPGQQPAPIGDKAAPTHDDKAIPRQDSDIWRTHGTSGAQWAHFANMASDCG
jgi:hypothetical protein